MVENEQNQDKQEVSPEQLASRTDLGQDDNALSQPADRQEQRIDSTTAENALPSDQEPLGGEGAADTASVTDSAGEGTVAAQTSPRQSNAPAEHPVTAPSPAAAASPATTPSTGAAPSPAAAPGPVKVPGPEADAELEKEIADALGDVDLLDVYGMNDEIPPEPKDTGDVRKVDSIPGINQGKVVGIADDGIFVDLGGKSQGFLPAEELEEGEKPAIGDTIEVMIVRYDARDGLVIVSRRSAEQQLLRRNLRRGARVEARVTGTNKGGLEMDIKGLHAFMPASQVAIHHIEELDSLIGERMECEVMEVEKGDRNIVLSRRKVLLAEEKEKAQQLWTEIQQGQMRHGVVSSIHDYGAFVDLGGIDGLLHVSELSWARVKHPKDVLKVGQGIDVVVIGIDEDSKRIALSLRQAGGDPWSTAEVKYAVGTRHNAQISNLMDFGAFAELEPGIEGLIPISEMTWAGRIRHPSDVVQPGQMVEVEILKLDVEHRKLSMSMKSLQDNPWDNVEEKYQKNNIYTGKVARITDFGAFVTLEAGLDGLVHISELSDKRVNKVSDVLDEGQEVQVRILDVDKGNRRVSLSLKGIGDEGQTGADAQQTGAEPPKAAKKRKKPLRGGLSW